MKAQDIGENCLTDFADMGEGEKWWGLTYNNLGRVYYSQGDYPKAIECYEKSLAIYLESLGSEHHDVASSYNNLGLVYDAQGDYPKAIEYYGNSLAIYLKSLGLEHPAVAASYNNLGSVYDYPLPKKRRRLPEGY